MDPVASPVGERLGLVGLTRRLVDIDSTTGIEGACGRVLAEYLRGSGFTVTEQPAINDMNRPIPSAVVASA